jgi:hypothetical protein
MEVEARELPSPTITFKKPVAPREGAWDLRGASKINSSKENGEKRGLIVL